MPKGIDYLENRPEAFERRQRIWIHNGLAGKVRMALTTAIEITRSATCSSESRQLGHELIDLCEKLAISLKDRKD